MRWLTTVLGVALVVTACSADPPAPTPKELPPVKHAPAQRIADKDEKAVLATLDGINPCALVDAPKGGSKRQRSPHLCVLDGAPVDVGINPRYPHSTIWSLPTKVIEGATVEVQDLGTGSCRLEIPVSFDYAVRISSDDMAKRGDACEVAEGYATTVIDRLRTPDKVRHPADRPDLSKDACTIIAAADAKAGRPASDYQPSPSASIDQCGVRLSMLIEPGPPEGGWGTKWRTIHGKDVYIGSDGCQWTWSEGTYAGEDNRLITVKDSADCKTSTTSATNLVGALIDELGKPQPPVSVSVTDLVYAAGQPTEPNPGACVDYPDDGCEPAVPVTVPGGAGFVTEAALADRHVACAGTADAVHAQFRDLRPVVPTYGAFCGFVEPSHAVQVEVRVQTGTDDVTLDDKPTVERPLSIAGRPAVYLEYPKSDNTPARATVCVDTGYHRDGDKDYDWCFDATFMADRNNPGPVDTSGKGRLVPLATAFAQSHLT